ncbi:helix-turn-helix domain-containing protein [Streptomyces sp. R11]|uniref:Helix-turn-helix domain-containing protein n=1 Tax=Streptomyces sp. R11 TaxID=3238625 RepID=A0AB39NDT7_9ACTN
MSAWQPSSRLTPNTPAGSYRRCSARSPPRAPGCGSFAKPCASTSPRKRSLRTASDRQHIARNTVTYRVKRAEELLPAATTAGSSLELRVALEIAAASEHGTSASG